MIVNASKKPLSSEVGEYIPLATLKDFVHNFKCEVRVDNSKNEDTLSSKFVVKGQVRKGEFFGLDSIEKLVNLGRTKKATGIRIYLGLAYEDPNDDSHSKISTDPIEGWEQRIRFFLTLVDASGKDIAFDSSELKDSPDGDGYGGGNPHPPYGQ
jgi:hypothetical protein